MTFDDIDPRLKKIGKDRAWLAKECDYSTSTLASALAPNGSNKTKKALRRMWEVLDREEERQKTPSLLHEKCAMIIRPSRDEFSEWNAASLGQHLTMEQWAIQQLNKAASVDAAKTKGQKQA